MKPLLRAIGVAVLALALLNVAAGLCFCHRGPVLPGDTPASAGCCHGPGASGTVVVKAASTCCHIESAESEATPAVAVQFAQPAATVTALGDGASALRTTPFAAATLQGSSPPLLALRI